MCNDYRPPDRDEDPHVMHIIMVTTNLVVCALLVMRILSFPDLQEPNRLFVCVILEAFTASVKRRAKGAKIG